MNQTRIYLMTLVMVLSACASSRSNKEPQTLSHNQSDTIRELDSSSEDSSELIKTLRELGFNSTPSDPTEFKEIKSKTNAIPIDMNPRVQKWILYFSKKDHDRFQRFLDQGSLYREVVDSLLEENNLPSELYYLAMIESGYSTRATSIAQAAGVWQFIPATGRRYGLEVNHYTDERRDPIRATEAAAKYLRDLYNVFGSWHLALAAYNAGEYRILSAVFKGKSRDFWNLSHKGVLPSETADYVPKFLAAVIIGENPTQFGFREPKADKYPNLEAIEVPSPLRLSEIAQVFQIPVEELKRVNPNLSKDITPPHAKTYEVWVPEDSIQRLVNYREQLSKIRLASLTTERTSQDLSRKKIYHVVQAGESLPKIANHYRINLAYLKRVNGLTSNSVAPGMTLRLTTKNYHPSRITRYRVKRGDQLASIAERFGVSIESLKVMNSLRKNQLKVGQVLKIKSQKTS